MDFIDTSCEAEMYKKVLHQVLQECDGAHNILDDVKVHASTEEEHDMIRECGPSIEQQGVDAEPRQVSI